MAGIFGDEINNREQFFEQLGAAEKKCKELIHLHPEEDELVAVQRQFEAIRRWTDGGRRPTASERKSLDMGLRMFREYETTEDDALAEFRDSVSILQSYMEAWPTDRVAADPNNDEYL